VDSYRSNPQLKLRVIVTRASGAFGRIHPARIYPSSGDGHNSINLPQIRGQDVEFGVYLATERRLVSSQRDNRE
jgi:hypothetical protein